MRVSHASLASRAVLVMRRWRPSARVADAPPSASWRHCAAAPLLFIFLLPLAFGLAACGPPATEVEEGVGNPDAGALVYKTHCPRCHQVDGTGKPSTGPALAADFNEPGGPLTRTDEELMRTMRLGRMGTIGTMPPWRGILSAKQQRDVLAYLRREFTPPLPEPIAQ